MNSIVNNRPSTAALIFRTTALFILLYQIRLLASDLADTLFFTASLAGALASAIFLHKHTIKSLSIRPLQAVIVIALVPWVIRLFIAMPRWFIPGVSDAAILLDSLLLNLDRNYFITLLPFYWVSITSYFSQRSRLFLRADIIAADTLFLVLFSIAPTASMDAYRWPILMVALFVMVIFLQILALSFSLPFEYKVRKRETVFAAIFLFLFVLTGGMFFIRPFQERAVGKGGGLLEPRLFQFDFSQILRLESEISMNDDLVLIVRKDPLDYHNLLRRYTLSGYSPRQGFFRHETIDETAHPQNLPSRRSKLSLEIGDKNGFRITEQEYYIVNFDSHAFIGMNMPIEVIPFESWDASSFNSAYAVKSHTSEALPYQLIEAVQDSPGPESLSLSPEEYTLYTEYGGDEIIASFAREIIQGSPIMLMRDGENYPPYWMQVQLIYDRLKFGEFRYSLKPGIASDGDQLKHFLFTSKKGYCSYYAFAFTLMLRSLGIPCRVAAGFLADPSTEVFGYYPVRSDMAHAWAEVWFPGYGWIEYDPTTVMMAEGEEFRFSQGTPPELFERLMKEILDNRSRLRTKEGEEAEGLKNNWTVISRIAINIFKKAGPICGAVVLFLIFLAIRSGFFWLFMIRKNPRKRALCLWAHTRRRLALAGLRKPRGQAEAEWAKDAALFANGLHTAGQSEAAYLLYLDAAAARFAPEYTFEDSGKMAEHYRLFDKEYRKAITPGRRLLAWFLPPLALLLTAAVTQTAAQTAAQNRRNASESMGVLLIFILVFSICLYMSAQNDQAALREDSDLLYGNALAAQRAENWERAIDLFSIGKKTYPEEHRFPFSLGNLYYQRKLYRLAWDEYRQAEEIFSPELTTPERQEEAADLFYQLANTAAFLNRNNASADYYEQFLSLEPDNREVLGNLAWMYFKLHRLEEGEKLLLDAIDHLGEDMDFAMTLGTIYSGLFRYQESKDSYLKAITEAEAAGDRHFAALSHYNLSILESRFYRYDLAYDRTNSSLEAMNRASGKLARGELYLMRMELPRALADYQEAYGIDNSPLSKLSLAELYHIGGRLQDAVLYATECLNTTDESWMVNYGIDPIRYKREIHEILKDSYAGLLKAESFFIPDHKSNFPAKELVQSFFRKITYKFRFSVHKILFRKYSLLAADAYKGTGDLIHPDMLIQYFNAYNAYPKRALAYLREAKNFEGSLIPASIPSYNYMEGSLLKNKKILNEALINFDPVWERDKITYVYTELALTGRKTERQEAAERLFAINRGALLRNGIRLPVEFRISASLNQNEGFFKKASKAAGLEEANLSSPRYTLSINPNGAGYISFDLYDNGRGIRLWKQDMSSSSSNRGSITGLQGAILSQALRDGIFNPFF